MILVIVEQNRIRQVPMKNNHQTVIILSQEVSFINREGRWHFHLPYPLNCQDHKLENGKEITITNRRKEKSAVVISYDNNTGFDDYRRYFLETTVSVIEMESGQILIQKGVNENASFRLLIDELRIEAKNEHAACNTKKIIEKIRFQDGDVISLGNMRMILEGDSLFINSCENIKVHLQAYVPDKMESRNQPLALLRPVHALDKPVETEFHITLPQPDQRIFSTEERPLIFMLGPALTMSFASLSVGILSAWRGWMQGRTLLDVLPMLILPCVMVFSTLLWSPLSYLFEKKRRKQKRDQCLLAYEKELALIHEEIRVHKRGYKELVSERYPYPDRIRTLFMESTVHEIHASSDAFLLRVGDTCHAFPVFLEIPWKEKDKELMDRINIFCRSLQDDNQEPWLIPVNQYRSICIERGENQDDLFHYLIFQIYWVYGLHMAFLIRKTENKNQVWIRKMASVIQERRMIFHDEPEALYNCEKHNLILISDTPVKSKNENVLSIMKGDGNDCIASLILDPQQEYYYDRLKHTTGSFSFTISTPFQPDKISQRIPYNVCNCEKDNGFLAMYDCEKAENLNVDERWKNNDVSSSLLAYLGMNENGNRIVLDLNEKKDGPHGLIAGMTGSGKSELIITMLLSLAVNYSPEDVQFALIDFKGGGISQAIGSGDMALPHIAGILTNLDTEEIERALVSFHQECIRREKLIAQMNSISDAPVMNLQDYRKVHSDHPELPSLSELIIVIDEFAELKRERPEFLKDLISIARIGRSLGVHLILATQKPGGSVSDEIWTNCSFKICLRVSQRQDSFEMLHNDDACSLSQSGSFFLLSNDVIKRGRGAYANMRHSINNCRVRIHDETGKVIKDSVSYDQSGPPEIISVLEVIREKSADYEKAHALWLNPLSRKSVSMVPAGKQIFGQYDDYFHHEQPWISFPETGSVLFVSMNQKEKKNFLVTILYTLLSSMNKNEELYLLDDISVNCRNLRMIRMFTDCFSSNHEEKRTKLFERILHRKDNDERIILIISDLSILLTNMEEDFNLLQKMLEQAELLNVLLIILAGVIQNIPYRIAGLITRRYVLKCEKSQEVQQILNCSGNHIQKKCGWGLLKKENVMEFRYITCEDEEMQRLVDQKVRKYGTAKAYQIPCMPEKIRASDYHGCKIPLGLRERDFSWCTIAPVETVTVVAMYPDVLEKIRHILFPYCKCRFIEESDADDAQVVLADFDAWMKERQKSEALLLIGEVFRQQYVYRCRKKFLKENEALFCYKHEREVIRIIEE